MSATSVTIRGAIALLLLASFIVTALPRRAHACSCAGPIDLRAAIDESEAAFVGSLTEKRNAGTGDFGGESIYVFEVEKWVKGDLGRVIEVRSATDGAACGFEFSDGDRIGAFLRLERGELHSGLCEQVDPDALLVAGDGPVLSSTGIGHLLIAHGWTSTRLTVIDQEGATVAEVFPDGEQEPFTGTTELVTCPEGGHAAQLTSATVEVWDLETLRIAHSYPAITPDGREWIRTISCRSADGSSILGVAQSENGATLYEIAGDWSPVIELPGETWHIGTSYVIAQTGPENDPVVIDMRSEEQTRLHETPPDELQAINVAPHPSRDRLAMLETRFSGGEGRVESTLFVLSANGETMQRFEIPWESYSPIWLDEERLLVQAYDFNDWAQSFGYLFDVGSGETTVIEGWRATYPIADGTTLYGIDGSDVLIADLATGKVETLATLPIEFAGPMVQLRDPDQVEVTTTSIAEPEISATPPLVANDHEVDDRPSGGLQWLAGAALAVFVVGLVWLARRSE